MVKGIVIPPADEDALVERELSSLADYQDAVGGWIEAVDIRRLGVTLYVPEEGQLLNQPFNPRATFLWWYYVPAARLGELLRGPVLIVGSPDSQGADRDVPEELRARFAQTSGWALDVRPRANPFWYRVQMTYDSYWEVLVWAMLILDRWPDADDVRIVEGAEIDEVPLVQP